MQKGILKKKVITALAIGGFGLFAIGFCGIIISAVQSAKIEEKKKELVESYLASEEYKVYSECEKDAYIAKLRNGEITGEDYDRLVKELSSEKNVEEKILEGDNLELKNQINDLNASMNTPLRVASLSTMGVSTLSALASNIYETRQKEKENKEFEEKYIQCV